MAGLNNTLGGIRLYFLGDLDGAEQCYKTALDLRRAAGDQQGELDALIKMREKEGKFLKLDLVTRLKSIAETLAKIREHAPHVVKRYQEQLRERIRRSSPCSSNDTTWTAPSGAILIAAYRPDSYPSGSKMPRVHVVVPAARCIVRR